MIHFIFIYSVIQFISILFFETETVILNGSGLTTEKDHRIQMPLRKQYTKPYTAFSSFDMNFEGPQYYISTPFWHIQIKIFCIRNKIEMK